jgi:predicted SnoaL-like aldol condensation-catalyzing enzyme
MDTATETTTKALVLVAFDTLFHKRDYAAAMQYWSPKYVQHSAHIAPGRDGLFNFVKTAPSLLKYEPGLIGAEGDYVFVHGRLSGTGRARNWIAADILRIEDGVIAEHWIVVQDEVAEADSKCGLPMFGERFLD